MNQIRMTAKTCILLFVLGLLLFLFPGISFSSLMPGGSYANDYSAAVTANPAVKGVMLPISWKNIETSQGVYDWTKLDNEISKVIAGGKDSITLSIQAGGEETPDWLMSLAVAKYTFLDTNSYHKTYCTPITIPVFWDDIFLAEKLKFIAAAGIKYGGNTNIQGVMVSFANSFSNEWYVPHQQGTFCDQTIDQVADWVTAGYTFDKMLTTGKATIDAWAAAFPTQALKLPINVTDAALDGTSTALAEAIVSYGYSHLSYGSRFFAQSNGISTVDPDMCTDAGLASVMNAKQGTGTYIFKMLYDRWPQTGLQMLSAASLCTGTLCRQDDANLCAPAFDPACVLHESVKIASSYGPYFVEFWQGDAEQISLQSILQWANDMMADKVAPSVPGNLKANPDPAPQVIVSWDEPLDNTGVCNYKIEKTDGITTSQINIAGTTYHDTDVLAGKTYTYKVVARDSNRNESGVSATVSITMDTPPTLPIVLDSGIFTGSPDTLSASWSSSDPESGIVEYKYRITQNTPLGSPVKAWTSTGTANSVTATGLSLEQGKSYYFSVMAKNGAGFWSNPGYSDGIKVDTTPATTPVVKDSGVYTVSLKALNATWSSSDPDSRVAGYQYRILQDSTSGPIIRDWTSTGSLASVSATGLSLLNGKTYYFGVRALNGAGLWSDAGYSDGIHVNTAAIYSAAGKVKAGLTLLKGVTMTLTFPGGETLTTVTGTLGNFKFANLPNGSYTITPVLSGYIFTPASKTITIGGSNLTGVTFKATKTP